MIILIILGLSEACKYSQRREECTRFDSNYFRKYASPQNYTNVFANVLDEGGCAIISAGLGNKPCLFPMAFDGFWHFLKVQALDEP